MDTSLEWREIAVQVLAAGNSGDALACAAELLCAAAGARAVELTMHAGERIAVVRHGELGGTAKAVNRSTFGNVHMLAAFSNPRNEVAHLVDLVTLALYARFADQSANVDALTGVNNRAALDRRLQNGFSGAIALIDVDRFKQYNDRYGHPAGDSVLRRVAQAVSATLGPNDFFARYGGEEFAALIDGPYAQAPAAAERMRRAVLNLDIVHAGSELGRVTISLGLAKGSAKERETEAIARADAQLYKAKQSGRNGICAEAETGVF